MGTQADMTSPVTRHPGQTPWQFDNGPVLQRNTLLLAAGALWVLLLMMGLFLTFG